jgi:hypothetical protein
VELSPTEEIKDSGSGSREEEVVRRGMPAVFVAAAVLLVLGGCGFLESSGPEGGVSPFVSNLRVSPSSVPCDREFVISFDYSDPQDDIEFMSVSYFHDDGFVFTEEVLWEHGGGIFGLEDLELTDEELEALDEPGFLDLSTPGSARYTTQVECGVGWPRGDYLVTIRLTDDNGHESNPRTDNLRLTSS